MQDGNTNQPVVDNAVKPVDFNVGIIKGLEPDQIVQFATENNRPLVYGNFDKIADKYKLLENIGNNQQQYDYIKQNSVIRWNDYVQGKTLERTLPNYIFPNSDAAKREAQRLGIQNSVTYVTPRPVKRIDTGMQYQHYNGNIFEVQTPDTIAESVNFIKTQEGNFIPKASIEDWENSINWKNQYYKIIKGDLDKNEPEYYFQETKRGEVIPSGEARQYYTQDMFSGNSIYGFARNFNKALGKSIGAVGDFFDEIYNIINYEFQAYDYLFSGGKNKFKTVDPKYSPYANLINFGNQFSQKNRDEEDMYSSSSGFVANFADGIGQIVPMIFGGGAMYKGANLVGLQQYAPKIARQTSLFIGATQGASQFTDEMRRLNIPTEERTAFFIPYFIATYMSEKILGPGILYNWWGKEGQTMIKDGVTKLGKNLVYKDASSASQKWYTKQSILNAFNTIGKKYSNLDDWAQGKLIPRILVTGGKEGVEEVSEHIMQNGVSAIFNGLQTFRANQIEDYYRNVKYNNNGDGTFTKIKNGERTILDRDEYQAELKEQEYAKNIRSGSAKMDINWNFKQDLYVMWSAGFVGAFAGHNNSKNKQENSEIAKLAYEEEMNKIKKEQTDEYINKKVNESTLSDEHDAQGNIIEYEQKGKVPSQRDIAKQSMRQKIDLYRQIIREKGIGLTDKYAGALDDENLTGDAITKMYSNIESQAKIKELTEQDAEANKQEIETLQQSIAKNEQDITDNLTPKGQLSPTIEKDGIEITNPDYVEGAKTSKRFTEEYNKIGSISHLLNEDALQTVKMTEEISGKKFTEKEKELMVNRIINDSSVVDKYINDPNSRYLVEDFKKSLGHHNTVTENYINNVNTATKEKIQGLQKGINEHINKVKSILENVSKEEGDITSTVDKLTPLIEGTNGINELISEIEKSKERLGMDDNISKELATSFETYHNTLNQLSGLINEKVPGMQQMIDIIQSGSLTPLEINPKTQQNVLTRETLSNEDKMNIAGLIVPNMMTGIGDSENRIIKEGEENIGSLVERLIKYVLGDLPISNSEYEKRKLLFALEQLKKIDNYLTFNKGYYQDKVEKDPLTKEHSYLNNFPQERLSEEQTIQAKKIVNGYTNAINNILSYIDKKTLSYNQEQFVYKVHYIQNDLNLLEELFNSKDEEVKKVVNEYFASGIIDQIKTLTNSDNISDFSLVLNKYNIKTEDVNGDKEKNDALVDEILSIEKGINEVYNKLSGKLNNEIEDFKKEFGKFKGYTYSNLQDFEGIPSINKKDFTQLTGQLSLYRKGKEEFEKALISDKGNVGNFPISPDRAADFYVYTKLTNLVSINRMGNNGAPTLSNIISALTTTQDKFKDSNIDIETYEQRMIITQVLNFLISDSKSLKVFGETNKSERIDNGIIVRGYAGTGKTTAVMLNVLGSLSELKSNNNIKVMVVGTHNELKKEHEGILKSLKGRYDNIEYITKTTKELLTDPSLINSNDIIFFDEVSAYEQPELNLIRDNKETKAKYVFLLDDGQIGSEDIRTTRHEILRTSEKTIPASQVFRSGINMFHNQQMFFRTMLDKFLNPNSVLEHEEGKVFNHDRYKRTGLYYSIDKETIYLNFIKEIESAKEEDKNGIVLIVDTKLKRDELISSGMIPEIYHENIKFVRKDNEDVDHAISGLKMNKTFIAIDFYTIPETDAYERLNKTRVGLTAVSRGQLYIEMIGLRSWNKEEAKTIDEIPGLEETINKIERGITQEELDYKQELRNKEIAYLNYINYIASKKEFTQEPISMNILDHPLTSSERDVLAKEVNEVYRKALTVEQKENSTPITQNKELQLLIKKNNETSVKEKRNAIFRKMFELYFSDQINEENRTVVLDLVDNYNNSIELYNKSSKSKKIPIIDNTSNYVSKLYQMFSSAIPGQLESIKNNNLIISNPNLNGIDVNGNPVHGNPLFIEVVGKTDKDEVIVDIIDIQQIKNKTEFRAYDNGKYGSYINMLPKGYRINNVKVIPIHITTVNGLSMDEIGNPIIMSTENKITAIQDGQTLIQTDNEYIPITESEYYSTRRNINDNIVVNNSLYINKKSFISVGVNGVVKQTNSIGNIEKLVDTDNGLIPYNQFIKEYKISKFGKKEEKETFISSALEFNDNTTFYGVTASDASDTQNLPLDKSIESRTKIWNSDKLHSVHYAITQLIMDGLRDGGGIVSLEYKEDYKAFNEVGEPELFHHAVLIQVDKKNIISALERSNVVGNNNTSKYEAKGVYDKLLEHFKVTNEEDLATKILGTKDVITIGALAKPEIQFGKYNKDRQIPDVGIYDLLKLDTREEVISTIEYLYKDAFKDDPNDLYRIKLKNLNMSRLLLIYDLAKGTTQREQTIDKVKSGTWRKKTDTGGLTYQQLEDKLNDYNFTINDNDITYQLSQKSVVEVGIDAQKLGMEPQFIKAFPKRYVTKSENDNTVSFNELSKEFEAEFTDIEKEYKGLKKDEQGLVEDFEEYKKLNEKIEKSSFIKLLKSNRSTDLFKDKAFLSKVDNEGVGIRVKGYLGTIVKNLNPLLKIVNNYIDSGGKFYTNILTEDNKFNKDNALFYIENESTPQLFISTTNMDLDVFSDNESSGIPIQDTENENLNVGGVDVPFRSIDTTKEYRYTSLEDNKIILNHILGTSLTGKKVKGLFNENLVTKPNGDKVFGKVMNGIIYLSNENNEIEEFTSRHEAMHFIMLHMLSKKGYRSVMKDISNIIGEDNTRRNMLEYAADTFMTKEIVTPKNWFERFILALKRILKQLLNKFGLYRPTLDTLIKDVREGVFANGRVHDINEVGLDELYKVKEHKYNNESANTKVYDTFGDTYVVQRILWQTIAPMVINNSHLGQKINLSKRTSKDVSPWINASLKTMKDFGSLNVIGENTVVITNKDGISSKMLVNQMNKKSFETAMENISKTTDGIANNSAYKQYIAYQLSYNLDRHQTTGEILKSDYLSKIMLQKLFPDIYIDNLLYNARQNGRQADGFDVNNEAVDLVDKMPKTLQLALYSIPLRTSDGKLSDSKNKYVNGNVMHGILIEVVQNIKNNGDQVTYQNILKEMNRIYNNPMMKNLTTAKQRQYIGSFLMSYGDLEYKPVSRNDDNNIENGIYNLPSQGSYALIKNKSKILTELKNKNLNGELLKQYTEEIESKIKGIKEFFGAIESTYGSIGEMEMNKGTVLYDNSFYNTSTKFNNTSLSKENIKNNILSWFMDKNTGFLKPQVKEKLLYEKKEFNVTKEGVFVKNNDSWIKVIDASKSFETSKDNTGYYTQLFNFLQIKINTNIVNSVIDLTEDSEGMKLPKNNFGEQLYMMMLSAKMNGLLEDQILEDNKFKPFEIGSTEEGEFNYLKSLYKSNGIRMESMKTTLEKGYSGEDMVPVPKPTDMWAFITLLGDAQKYDEGNTFSRMTRTVEGERVQIHNLVNNLTKTVGLGSDVFVKKINKDLKKAIKNGTEINPLFVKDGKLFRNSFFNGNMEFSRYKIFNGIESDKLGVTWDSMQTHDRIKFIVESVYNDMVEQGTSYVNTNVFTDDMGGKKQRYVFGVKLKGNSPISLPNTSLYNNKRVVSEIRHQYSKIVPVIDDYVSYYKEIQRQSLERWSDFIGTKFNTIEELKGHTGTFSIDEVKNKLLQSKDYHIVGDKVILGNETTLSFTKNEDDKFWYNNEFITKWESLSSINDKMKLWWDTVSDAYSGFVDLIDESGYKMLPEMERLNPDVKVNDQLRTKITSILKNYSKYVDLTTIDLSKYESIKELNTIKKEFQDKFYSQIILKREIVSEMITDETSLKEQNNKIVKDTKKIQKEFTKDFNKVINEQYGADKTGNSLLQSIFMSFHLFNETMSQASRGGVLSASNISDYIKRGAGFVAPSQGYNSEQNRYIRSLHVEDIPGTHSLFSNKVNENLYTDGEVTVNPITLELIRRESGGFDGIITNGMQKPVIYYYDPITNKQVYIKSAFLPINGKMYRNSALSQSIFRTMLGPELSKYFDSRYKFYKGDFKKTVSDVADYVSSNYSSKNIDHGMVGYVIHGSAFKLGIQKQIKYKNIEGGLATANLDMTPEEVLSNSFMIDNDNFGIQKITTHETQDPYKPIPVQIVKLIGIGQHNAERASKMEASLSSMVRKYETKIKGFDTYDKVQGYIKQLAHKSLLAGSQTGIFADDVNKVGISLETIYKRKSIALLLADANKATKPSIPGVELNQAPFKEFMYKSDKTGQLYTAEDLKLSDDRQVIEGYTSEEIKPFSVYGIDKDGNTSEYTNKELLIQDLQVIKNVAKLARYNTDNYKSNIIVVPAEVVTQFPYMKEFGINTEQTLIQSMTITVNGIAYNMYETGLNRAKQNYKKEDLSIDDRISELKKMFGDMSDKEIIASLPDNNQQKDVIASWNTKESLIKNIATYYKSFNDALDVISTRIPTGSGASAFVGRIVAFDNESQNTIYTSAKKNLLDGSDYDIDALQIYYNAIRTYSEEQNEVVVKEQQLLFGILKDYFTDPLNLEYQLQETTTDNIKNAAEQISDISYPSEIGSMFKITEYNSDGQKLIGTEASGENSFNTVLNIPYDVRQRFDKRLVALREDESILQAIGIFMEFINAGTDAVKLDGAPGKLNINEYTAPYSTGLIAEGKSIDDIISALQEKDIIDAMKIVKSSNNINRLDRTDVPEMRYKRKIWHGIDEIISKISNDVTIDDNEKNDRIMLLEDAKISSYEGEVLRQLSVLSKIQQKIASDEYEFYKRKIDTKLLLGMPLNVFLENIETIKTEGGLKFHEEYSGQFDDPNILEMRKTLDGAYIVANSQLLTSYIELIQEEERLLNTGISTMKYGVADIENKDFVRTILDKNNYDNKDDYNTVVGAIDKHIQGKFISTLEPITISFRLNDLVNEGTIEQISMEFNPSKMQDRTMFSMLMPSQLSLFKESYPENYFIQSLKVQPRGVYSYVELPNSIYLNDAVKSLYRSSFKSLPQDVKNIFMYYQMIFFGNTIRQGAMTEVIDNDYKPALSNFIKDYEVNNTKELAEQIVVTEGLGAKGRVKPGTYKTLTDKSGRIYSYYLEGKNKHFRYNPTWKEVNNYGTNDNVVSDYKSFPSLSYEDVVRMTLNKSNEVKQQGKVDGIIFDRIRNKSSYKKFSGWNGIYSVPKEGYELLNDDIVELPTGIRVRIETDGDNALNLVRVDDVSDISVGSVIREIPLGDKKVVNPTDSDLYNEILKVETTVLTNAVMDVIIEDNKRTFPGMKTIRTSDNDINNPHYGTTASFTNGNFNFNIDRMTINARLHEVSHIFILNTKQSNIALYNELIESAKWFIENHSEITNEMRKRYSDDSESEFLEEIAAKLMGWSEISNITSLLHSMRVMNVDTKAGNIFDKISDLIAKFWNWVKSIFTSTYGIKDEVLDFDFKQGTIFDLGKKLASQIKKGKVSRISTDSFIKLVTFDLLSNIKESAINNTLNTAKSATDKWMNYKDQVQFDQLEYDSTDSRIPTQVNVVFNDIIINKKIVSRKYTGGDIVDLSDKGPVEIRKIIKRDKYVENFLNQDEQFIPKFKNLINNHGGNLETLSEVFGVNDMDRPKYDLPVIERLLKTMTYVPGMRLYNIDEAIKFVDGFTLSEESYKFFKNSRIHVLVENKGKKQTVISLYTFTNNDPRGTLAGVPNGNILSSYNVSNREAKNMGLVVGDDTNGRGSTDGVIMGLLAAELISNKNNFVVHEIGTIGVTQKDVIPYFRPFLSTLHTINGMGKSSSFLNDVPSHLRKWFTGDILKQGFLQNTRIDFGKIIESMSTGFGMRNEEYSSMMFNIKNKFTGTTIKDQQIMYTNVLDKLNLKAKEDRLTSEEMYIHKIVSESLYGLNHVPIDLAQWNNNDAMGYFHKFIASLDIKNEFIQKARGIIDQGLRKVVHEVNKKMKLVEGLHERAKKIGLATPGEDYNKLIVKVPIRYSNSNGNEVETDIGFIHHTKDDNFYMKDGKEIKFSSLFKGTKEELAIGQEIVDQITDQMEDSLLHNLKKEGKGSRLVGDKWIPYEKKDMLKLLIEKGYRPGMIPIMGRTKLEHFMKKDIGSIFKQSWRQVENPFTVFDEGITSEGQVLDELNNRFFNQMTGHKPTMFGDMNSRLSELGIMYNENNGEYYIPDEDNLKKNSNISHDMEHVLNYFRMSATRKMELELETMPLISAMKVHLKMIQLYKGQNVEAPIEYLEGLTNRAVLNKAVTGKAELFGINTIPLVQVGTNVLATSILAFNLKIGILSGGNNFIKTMAQGFANRSYDDRWTDKEILPAITWLSSHLGEAKELNRLFQITNMTEGELISSRMNRKTMKSYTDQQIVHGPNFWTDYGCRITIMIAQMMKDGTLGAFTFNKKEGTINYDWTKDPQWKDLKTNKATQVRFNAIRNKLISEGRSREDFEGIDVPYTLGEASAIAWYGDKIVGGYTPINKVNASNFIEGRMFSVFKNFFYTAWQDAFANHGYNEAAGKIKAYPIDGGEFVAQVEKLEYEGYSVTMARHVYELFKNHNIEHYKNMKPYEKANYRKLLIKVSTFLSMTLLYQLLVSAKGDKDKDKLIKENGYVKKWQDIANSLFVVTPLVDFVKQPFAALSMIDRIGVLGVRQWDKMKSGEYTVDDAKKLIPSQVNSIIQVIDEDFENK